ncbi:RNA polymerase sigma factor [Specibacter cremeus]|uniref:RNA polymerase sigma factor n=1 Tax=Specibacter cremeus TaxID=1629051 RepID=UPI000F7B35AD|nr:RNA polymerase sigma factor [Specibacter cremeus]
MTPAPTLPPFEFVVEAHGAAVLRVCRALVGVQDADDVWQETFLAALRAYPESAGVRNREAWLVTIARNKATDHHRKAGRLPVPVDHQAVAGLDSGVPAPGVPRPAAGGDDAVVRAVAAGETATVLWAAIGALPPRQREAVVYHHLAGLPHAEAATLMGGNAAAARRAAADGMRSLRAALQGTGFDGKDV